MHYKNYIYIFFLFLSIVSCSNNKNSHFKNDITFAEEKEILIQKKILINEMASATKMLHKISWPILLKNKNKCKNNKNKSYGSLFADIEDLPKEDQNIFLSIFNKSINSKYFYKYQVLGFPIILSVAKNSPAFHAGLLANDIILEINDKSTKNFREELAFILKNENNLKLKILRSKEELIIDMVGVSVCSYNVQVLPSGFPNAFADGEKVFITMAAIKLAKTSDELAFLIGHELAHNILHYKNFNANEANLLAIDYLDKPKVRQMKSVLVWSNENREIEADIEGTRLAFNAGFSLENVNDYWRRLSVFNPELIKKSINIYKSNAYRAALISKTLKMLKENNNAKR
tara:strand:- start:638 stop:1672 length:1035 start_codon:yes stop_codon:yes gene_type:complete